MTPANEASETAKDIVGRLRATLSDLHKCKDDRPLWVVFQYRVLDKLTVGDFRGLLSEIERLQAALANVTDSQEARLAGMEEAETVARSDASFDGRDFATLGRADRQRYLDRAAAGQAAIRAAAQKEGG